MGDPLSVLDKLEAVAALKDCQFRVSCGTWGAKRQCAGCLSRTAVPALVRGLRKALAGLEGCDHAQRCGTDPRRTGVCLRCAARESALSELRGMGEE